MRKAFTLIELLACVIIVTLLVAVVVSTASRAKTGSINAVSISNLRQILLAESMYMDHHDDKLPPDLWWNIS
ncbi:type II secretion system protein, partial [Acinetobacter baumannii]